MLLNRYFIKWFKSTEELTWNKLDSEGELGTDCATIYHHDSSMGQGLCRGAGSAHSCCSVFTECSISQSLTFFCFVSLESSLIFHCNPPHVDTSTVTVQLFFVCPGFISKDVLINIHFYHIPLLIQPLVCLVCLPFIFLLFILNSDLRSFFLFLLPAIISPVSFFFPCRCFSELPLILYSFEYFSYHYHYDIHTYFFRDNALYRSHPWGILVKTQPYHRPE